jgi:putative ABC transport system permease protein
VKLSSVLQQLLCISPGHVRRRPLRFVLSIISIAVGVAMFVSMRITQASIQEAARVHHDSLAGRAQFVVTGAGGVDEAVLGKLEKLAGVCASPIVQGAAVYPEKKLSLMVLGVDAVRDAKLRDYQPDALAEVDLATLMLRGDAIVVPRGLAGRMGWSLKSKVRLVGPERSGDFVVGGILRDDGVAAALGGNLVILNVNTAQRFLSRQGRFDRIELALSGAATSNSVSVALPAGCSIETAGSRDPTFDFIYSQFQTIVICVTMMACVIGLFIVYNASSLSVVERAKQLGVLRALGATRGEALAVFIVEAGLTGLIASVLGVIGGWFAADQALAQADTQMNILLSLGKLPHVVPWDAMFLGPFVGILAAILGAASPARAAANLPPVMAMKPGSVEQSLRVRAGLWFVLALPAGAACLLIVRHPKTNWDLTVIGVGLGLLAVAMAGPQLLLWLQPLFRRAGEELDSVPAMLAIDNIVKFPSRTSLTVIALGGSLSLVVAIKATVGTLNQELSAWMNQIFVFDVTCQTNDFAKSAFPTASMPPKFYETLKADPACSEVYGVRTRMLPFGGEDAMLIAYETAAFAKGRIDRGVTDDPVEERRRSEALRAGKVAVSRNFARIHGVRAGDMLKLDTPSGPREFQIDYMQTDFTWFRGCVFMELGAYRNLWRDESLSYIDIRARPGADLEAFRTHLTQRWSGDYGVYFYRADQLREYAQKITTDWFALANMQLILGIIIGGIGVANTLLVSVLTQSRQIGMIRAVGATVRQVQQMLAIEGATLGLLGGLAGCIMGEITTRLLVAPMAIKASGFELAFTTPYLAMATAIVTAILIGLAAAVLPIRAAGRLDVVQAIGYE